MKFKGRLDIVKYERNYRGSDRSIDDSVDNILDTLEKKDKMQFYNEYCDFLGEAEDDLLDSYHYILPFYARLKEFGCDCEMIWVDIEEHTSFYNIPIKFLGIDIESTGVDSLIKNGSSKIKKYLNENGLCQTYEDALKVFESERNIKVFESERNRFSKGDQIFDIVYIYKIIVE